MTYLLARLGRLVDTSHREVFYRGALHVDEVSDDVASLAEDELVLLSGFVPPWRYAALVRPLPWPDIEHPRALWQARERPLEVELDRALASYGAWHVDPRGVPCEIGIGRQSSDVSLVLNYAGWRIADFPSTPIRIWQVRSRRGVLWIVPPESVPLNEDRQGDGTLAVTDFVPASQRTFRRPVAPPSPAPPTELDRKVRFRAMRFHDGCVALHLEQRYMVNFEASREIYNAVRPDLDAERPEGLRVVGKVWGKKHCELEIPELASVFRRLEYDAYVAEALQSQRWLDGEQLARARPGAEERGELDWLLDVPSFGLQDRVESFRLLFSIRDREQSVLILPGRDVLIPVTDRQSGRCWFVWEKVEPNHATYVFHPTDEEEKERMLAWIAEPSENKRSSLLASEDLKAALGYKRRVIHTGAGRDVVRWWREVLQALEREDSDG